ARISDGVHQATRTHAATGAAAESLAFAANQASNASDEPVAGGISQITRRTLIDDVTSHYSTQFWRAASILPRSFG
ncbi:hypothetical protein, partial [Escherichia coli]|uniref:hypothetical protein n=3 Tax=Pseudomonadati TaxID=3379134 RepID=UPI001851EA09